MFITGMLIKKNFFYECNLSKYKDENHRKLLITELYLEDQTVNNLMNGFPRLY